MDPLESATSKGNPAPTIKPITSVSTAKIAKAAFPEKKTSQRSFPTKSTLFF
jgi:hypothetical protein